MSKTLKIGVFCDAYYTSEIEVPDDMSMEESIEYARKHLDDIPIGTLDWISDHEIDELNCDFE